MRVLIVEDNAFNAFCLTRLLEAACQHVQVTVAHNSYVALKQFEKYQPELIVLDGDLGAGEGRYCNGPALADVLWRKYPNAAVVAWTDCKHMRMQFAEIFHQHNKHFNEYSSWNKIMCPKRLHQSLAHLAAEFDFRYYTRPSSSIHMARFYA
ncbi:response regulator [Legionella oakridgensis]|uniref:Response regulator containing a CheY-like receiver domain and an HTH DNA-binding domain n=2 Tax=Legionella oakridgensis TaxID=29423 RepID=W0B772_9GAMM|nr:response regulator [Legionella oakridgensis]AHE65715.1 response regulator containing a CheY-like receiver domain and an HTH DNA-binding domain [Legionella oakridgensis ATCC 33761 = DSM 21215]ETO94441.1 response regulator [Legionella oakridgensis RV-2-2007]KTD38208.1 two component sensor and regulator histidine kinase response regulator [Legionella oakridgensis]STY15662.1 two component sensor and regulator, histidine kinase response regulator [Legionella longbeachae]